MLKKYKILLLIIALTAGGITTVLSLWLYSNYKSERTLLVGTVERSLFNVLQNYYHNEFLSDNDRAQEDSVRRHKFLLNLVGGVYPNLDLSKLKATLDTMDFHKSKSKKQRATPKNEAPAELLPLYLLERLDFNDSLVTNLEGRLGKALERNKIDMEFKLMIDVIPQDEIGAYVATRKVPIGLMTRPILVSPEGDEYLVAKFNNPWPYLLSRLAMQLSFSFLLLAGVIGTFQYLFKTIKKQDELASLRRSFVNNMTHELKTPVATVMAAVEAIQRFVNKDDKERMEKYLELSKAELDHLSAMIEKVMEVDVDERNRVELVKKEFDLVAVAKACVETVEISAGKELHVEFFEKEPVILLEADELHVKNVISNLLDNAVKYSAEPVFIEITLDILQNTVEISVRDKGKGIDKEHFKSIFDPFYRVQEGNIYDVKGFGLGLSYVKQIVEQHGGNVHVKSERGKGSEFVVSLPKKV
ncbi:HAMP domain-containing sensor histidine kinase [Sphingobacterium sp. UT-1RO-CII-1]|uniref:sensor histidine kinase n=1 Tax=Sphingobacterium sp. UT-1RO-CII-1 TaxID=2995225 RepID=UPI00227D27A5|nr:HAMP domain-containing sensor histidine kinase [Sphingobacterium sp. UT-1RO-CII-1]MCY4780901.1 HAMP domain-containing sensor histidine kinase [Sphingobacterium sp. UT-1RO-CII-1]